MEEKTIKDIKKPNIEKRYNIWFYIGTLYISFFAGNYFETEISMFSFIGQLNMLFTSINSYVPYAFVIIFRLITAAVHVALFELFSRVFYGLSNAFSFGAVSVKAKDFVAVLRIFVILINFALGLINLLYYLFNFLIPLGIIVLSFAVTSAGYLMFFMYLNQHYLDKKTAHRAFRSMAMLYLVFTLFNLLGGIMA